LYPGKRVRYIACVTLAFNPERDVSEREQLIIATGSVPGALVVKSSEHTMADCITYEDLFQLASLGLLVIDRDGTITNINDKAIALLHLTKIQGVGDSLFNAFPPAVKAVRKCLRSRKAVTEHQLHDKQAHLILSVSPIIKKNKLIGAICTFQELKAFEVTAQNTRSYRTLNRQLETIFQSSSDGIWVCSGSGTIISVNKASEELNGIRAADIVGKNVVDLLKMGIFDQSVTTKVMANKKRETVMQYIAKTDKYLLSTGTPSLDEHGNIAMIVINERDMTELNSLRRRYEQSQKVKEKYKEELSELSLRELEQNSIVADSSKMRNMVQMALKLSNIDASNILILGESGTGKGLLAKLIHKNSKRRGKPFIEINCAALPENLLEAELFGYEKGAFTGASDTGKVGLIELAQEGTLFLDEIGDLPLTLQSKLLKFFDNQEIRRVGGTESLTISCSTIAATNQNLKKHVAEKAFREDLYYRLSSFILTLPPLKERPEDIASLVRMYLREFNTTYECSKTISPQAIRHLLKYPFPGNIRELKSIIQNAVVMSETNQIDDFIKLSTIVDRAGQQWERQYNIENRDRSLSARLEDLEKQILQEHKNRYQTTRRMALTLGISQPSVVRKLHKYKIS